MTLRDFQKEVYRLIIKERKNVILQAPTGAGKTLAALYPFFRNLEQEGDALPYKCLYATPLRTLTNQFYEEYKDLIVRIDKRRGTNFVKQCQMMQRPTVSIQTGEQPYDSQFESLLTFCTIDQLLASAIGTPYSVGTKMANINVAAVFGSYLVLDEFHLYPLAEDDTCYGARTTILAFLMLLKDVTRFIVMTATLSDEMVNELAQQLNAEVVKISDDKLTTIMQERQRTLSVADAPMTPEAILKEHDQCSLVICNTVARAQAIYWALREKAHKRGIELILLHSRLSDADRKIRSETVTHQLGKFTDEKPYGWKDGQYFGENIIVVATQVVEVGLDISVQVLHTENAPANSLIQRAGRCARFAKQQGRVIVYPLPEVKGKPVSTKPYNVALCEATFQALKRRDPQQPFDFLQEQELINIVHTKSDLEILSRFHKRIDEVQKNIFTGLREHCRGIINTLIRDVAQVNILIHDKPEVIQEAPWQWQSFSLHPDSLAAHMEFLESQRTPRDLKWVCKQARAVLQQNKKDGEEQVDSRQEIRYIWDTVPFSADHQSMACTLRESIMLVLPNALATYHPELGFVLREEDQPFDWPVYESPRLPKKNAFWSSKPMRVQSYLQHIGGLVDAYNTGIAPTLKYVMQRLEAIQGLSKGSIDHTIRLVIACHDLGKLSEQWQQWAWEWQEMLYTRQGRVFQPEKMPRFFAKTDYDSNASEQRDWQGDTKVKRPNHACESVVFGMSIIADSLGVTDESSPSPLLLAACAAIAHHHSTNAYTYKAAHLQSGVEDEVRKALERSRQTASWSFNHTLLQTKIEQDGDLKPTTAEPCITVPAIGKIEETWLYYIIVRALRLADQHADDFVPYKTVS